LAVNDKDDEALKRVINYPRRGIGQKSIGQIIEVAEANELSMWQTLSQIEYNARTKRTVGEFVKIVNAIKAKSATSDAYETAVFISKKSGIVDELKSDNSIEGMNRLENINALLDGIKEFVEDDTLEEGEEITNDRSLAAFLQSISLMTDQDIEEEGSDKVTLMSVHAAKGLEFQSVFVTGLEENLFPSYMSLTTPDQVDEERRLFYVAITRAEQYLTLSYANSRYQYGQMRFNDPSRFLEEISEKNIDSLISISKRNEPRSFGEPKILGNFKRISKQISKPRINPADFNPSPSHKIKEGMKVLHIQFGEGEVLKIDNRNVATIKFFELDQNQEKRIMLQYAKLQIIE
jgi:DNA helicase-2/ATP-dependent DNA helicase PcrA